MMFLLFFRMRKGEKLKYLFYVYILGLSMELRIKCCEIINWKFVGEKEQKEEL